MKKIVFSLFCCLLTSPVFSQDEVFRFYRVNKDSFEGKEFYEYLTEYSPSKQGFLGEHVTLFTPKDGKGDLYPCIKMERLNLYDSFLNSSFLKYKEWSRIADSINSPSFEKEIGSFLSDGSVIDDYGISIGPSSPIKVIFVRKNSYFGEGMVNKFVIKSFCSDDAGIRKGIYFITMEKMKGNPTVDQKFQFYMNSMNKAKILKAYKKSVEELSAFK